MEALAGLDPRLRARAQAGAAWLREQAAAGRTVTVVCHIDADGVTGGAVAAETLHRAGIPHRVHPVKSLDDTHIKGILDAAPEALWFTDLGSTAYMRFPGVPRLVCDHHDLVRDGTEEDFPHVSPRLDGLPSEDVSGAGTAFLVALAHDPRNLDLLPVALVGASADMQDRREGTFSGTNAVLLAAGRETGLVEVARDLSWFGVETRPLRKFLSLASDPAVPGISRDGKAAEALLARLEVPLTAGGKERTWSDLAGDERQRLASALADRMLDCGMGAEAVESMFRDVVRITGEPPGTPTRELREFGTLLNGTARYDRPEVGLAVARGDRDEAYREALELLTGHRKHLVGALAALARRGVSETDALQWVHLESDVRDTVVGTVCGMALDGLGLRRDKPIIGFAHAPDGKTKVSSRAPHELQGRIDLATAMREGAGAVGGQGGGHKGAAGATIPRDAEQAFLAVVDGVVAGQLGGAGGGPGSGIG